MKNKVLCAAAVGGVLMMTGCGNQSGTAEKIAGVGQTPSSSLTEVKPTAENTAVIINGKPISRALLQAITADVAQRSGGQPVPEDKIIDGLIARELLNQEAEKENLAKDPAVAAKLENARRDVLVQAQVEHYRKTATVSEEELKKEYDTRIAALKGTEYKARHILLETEAAAKEVIAKLQKDKNAKFDELAKKLSKDPSAKQNGGDLGWFNPQQMVAEFSAAVAGLKNGETTSAPVKSQFGWHVIQREDSREQTPPAFDAVKEQFRAMLLGQKLQKHVEELKAAAKIERLTLPAPAKTEPPKTEAPAAAAPSPADGKTPPPPVEAGKPAAPAPAAAPKPAK
jgi:peptidyl-prolyl cis-trans isomerase C